MDRIIIDQNGIKSKCNEFKPFEFKDMNLNEQTRLQNWLNKNLKPIKFNKFLENLSETADEQDIKNTLEQALKHKFPEEIMEVEVTKNLIIIGILSPYSKKSALGGIEDYLGLNNYRRWYDEGDYAFDHMAYGFYKIKRRNKYMSDFTTIQIRKETKQKLDLMKAENRKSYDRLIQNLLEQSGGQWVDDVITVTRDTVAMSLKYWEINTPNNFKSYDITFQELKIEPVGTTFTANPQPADDNFVNSVARIVAKEGDDVILLCREISYIDGKWDSVSSVAHINLF